MPQIIAALCIALWQLLISVFVWLIKKIFILFGIWFVSYNGVEPFINSITNNILHQFAINDSFGIIAWLGVMKFGQCVSIIISASSFVLISKFKDKSDIRIGNR